MKHSPVSLCRTFICKPDFITLDNTKFSAKGEHFP